MNRIFLLLSAIFLFSLTAFCQENWSFTDPEKEYKQAKEYFMRGDYALAYPLLKPLIDHYPGNTESDHAYINQDLKYFYVVTGLNLNHSSAEQEAKSFIESSTDQPRQQLMSYHLAKYFFVRENFADAIVYYERAGYDNLSEDQKADAKFELAYAYFRQGDLKKAGPLFDEIARIPSNKHFADANYYVGYISFKNKNYARALKAFQNIENEPAYRDKIPYYIAQIYYFQGQKDQALTYGERALSRSNARERRDLSLLIGQIYFEKKDFANALPLLENYVHQSDKVTKEVMYELAYCYYDANRTSEAIDAFKQLSNEQDSLGQNSMYLLGDLYLKAGQKNNARNAFQYSADNNSNRYQQEVSLFNYAKLSYELGYSDIALTSTNRFLEEYPQSAYDDEAKEILINLLANSNNYAEALRLYQSFGTPTASMQEVYPRILLGRAAELINNRQYDDADVMLNQIVQAPYNQRVLPLAWFWKGEIAYRQKNYSAAISNFNKYLPGGIQQGEATPVNAHYALGYAYLQTGEYPKAYQNFTRVTTSIGASSSVIEQDAYVRAADALFMQKDYGRAKTMYRRVADLTLTQSDYSLYQIALIDGIDNQPAKIAALNQLVKRYPLSELVPEAYMQIADAYMAQEKFQDAIPYLKMIFETSSASGYFPEVYLKLGLAYYNLNNNAEALKNYQDLLGKYPQSPEADEALVNMESIYVEQGKPQAFVDIAQKAGKSLSVSRADSLNYASALLQYNNGNCSAAISSFTNYLASYPNGSYALDATFNRSECYRNNKDWQNAVSGYAAVVARGSSRFADQAALYAARIYYVELKNYDSSKVYFSRLLNQTTDQENRLEALRGLTRSYYQTNDFGRASEVSSELLKQKGISTDDKAIANLVLGKSQQLAANYSEAISSFKKVTAANKSVWGAEARYEIAKSYFLQHNLPEAEKAGMDLIKVGGSDYWVASGYILLGDIYLGEKDYFNAKATFKSVADNATIPELQKEASEKYNKAVEEEKASSKITSENK